ncbi:MAG: NUDIX hydrolase [Acidimicrobiales bacterium]
MNPSPTLGVGGIAVHRGRVLLVQRGKDPGRGLWAFPGGKVEVGETMAEAVVRELAEETGLAVRCGPLRGWVERVGPGYHFVILDFDVEVVGTIEPVPGDDAADAGWFSAADLTNLPLVAGMFEFMAEHGVLDQLS